MCIRLWVYGDLLCVCFFRMTWRRPFLFPVPTAPTRPRQIETNLLQTLKSNYHLIAQFIPLCSSDTLTKEFIVLFRCAVTQRPNDLYASALTGMSISVTGYVIEKNLELLLPVSMITRWHEMTVGLAKSSSTCTVLISCFDALGFSTIRQNERTKWSSASEVMHIS